MWELQFFKCPQWVTEYLHSFFFYLPYTTYSSDQTTAILSSLFSSGIHRFSTTCTKARQWTRFWANPKQLPRVKLSTAFFLHKSITSIKLNTNPVTCRSYLNFPDCTPYEVYKSQYSVRIILNFSVTFASSLLSPNILTSKNLNTKHKKKKIKSHS